MNLFTPQGLPLRWNGFRSKPFSACQSRATKTRVKSTESKVPFSYDLTSCSGVCGGCQRALEVGNSGMSTMPVGLKGPNFFFVTG